MTSLVFLGTRVAILWPHAVVCMLVNREWLQIGKSLKHVQLQVLYLFIIIGNCQHSFHNTKTTSLSHIYSSQQLSSVGKKED